MDDSAVRLVECSKELVGALERRKKGSVDFMTLRMRASEAKAVSDNLLQLSARIHTLRDMLYHPER
jgi:hypothetical protein